MSSVPGREGRAGGVQLVGLTIKCFIYSNVGITRESVANLTSAFNESMNNTDG